jgi:Mce-associated membrane protein
MAEHADSAEQVDDDAPTEERAESTEATEGESTEPESEHSDVREPESEEAAAQNGEKPVRHRFSGTRTLIAAGLVIVAGLAGTAGWLGYRAQQAREAKSQHNLFLQVARQAAINLTTISYTEVDADIQRILDSATGAFRDDFQKRSGPFVEVVKQVQSKSEGTVSEAGFLLPEARDHAQVLLAVSVKTSTAAAPEQEPRRWRLRLDVQKTNDGAKVSNVEFVP